MHWGGNKTNYMKEINLLPNDKRFSYKRYFLKKVLIAFLFANLFFLVLIYGFNIYLNKRLHSCIVQRKKELNNIISLESQLGVYENKYKKLLKSLSVLKKEEKRLKSIVFVRRSAFASTIVCLNTFTKDVGFESLSYNNGYFNVSGLANSLRGFQTFYYSLEKNGYIRDLRLYSVKRKGDIFVFKISYKVKY